jgi:hypothetical protein
MPKYNRKDPKPVRHRRKSRCPSPVPDRGLPPPWLDPNFNTDLQADPALWERVEVRFGPFTGDGSGHTSVFYRWIGGES